jgi:UDPglucose 6-dehydrogenase
MRWAGMARVTVVGTGYVGAVTAVCLAFLGHDVVGLDIDRSRVEQLAAGQLPFHEPGMPERLEDALKSGRLSFASDPAIAVTSADVIFLCVGTPTGHSGVPDMSQIEAAVRSIAPYLKPGAVVVNKSTVPVGSGNWVRTLIEEALPDIDAFEFHVVSNPEFLREGAAVEDFLYPDRIVLGGESGDQGVQVVADLYYRLLGQDFEGGRADFQPQLIRTDLPSAEMVKYAANAFLATKISFANEIANICEFVGADPRQVLSAIGADSRIGSRFLQHGIGWGGSCFGKDVAALITTGLDYGYGSPILRAIVEVNQAQRVLVLRKLQATLKTLKGRRIAVFGLAFKPDTDDLRDAPSIEIIRRLHAAGAVVSAYDPIVKEVPGFDDVPVRIGTDAYDAADRADAVVIATEWPDFAALDLRKLRESMKGSLILDGRGVIAQAAAAQAGLTIKGFGW